MRNKAMQRKLETGEAIDVERVGTPVPGVPGVWQLPEFVDGADYCVGSSESWIWSIGRRNGIDEDAGRIVASTDQRFYMNPSYECLWLR
jgi:hypothetical protein